jgi:phosphate uptake regulator
MKRKINRVGQNTLTVSLPSKWVKDLNLKAGDELNIKDEGKKLIISPDDIKNDNPTEIILDIDYDDKIYIRSLLGAMYRKGYDIIRIRYEDDKIFKIVKECTNHLIGFEIMEQGNKFCIIQSFLHESEKEFENTVYKMINIIKTSINTLTEDYKNNNLINLKDMDDYRYNGWKLRDYALRILYKKKLYCEINSAYETILWTLEKINRDFMEIYEDIVKKEIKYNKDISKYIDQVSNFFLYFAKNISSTEIKKIKYIHENFRELLKEGAIVLEKKEKEVFTIFILMGIINRVQDMSSALYIKNLS